MHLGLETHFNLTIREPSPFDLAKSRQLNLSGAPLSELLGPGEQFWALVPNALAAPSALIHANRVAVP